MSEWIAKPLGEVTSYIAKGIPPKYVEEESDNTIRVLNQKCNRDFRITYGDSRLHDNSIKKAPEKKMLLPGDVLINSTGTGTAGRVAQIWNVSVPTTIDGHMILMRPTEEIDALYYGYAIKSYQPAIESYAEGSTGQTEINKTRLQNETIISFPTDKEEQHRIGRFLADIDEKILENENINKNLEQQAQAIFKYWFVDFEPFGNNMPDNWTMGIINDLAEEIICGKTPSTKIKEYYGSDIPFITIPDMHGNTYAVTTERYLSQYGANSQPKKSLPKNSTCISCIGTAGLVTLVATESQTNQQINSIIPKHDYSPYYIYLLMQTMSKVINKLGQSGSTIVNLNKAQFGKMQAIIPSITVMKSFDEVVSPIFEMILERQMENARLVSLRDILLPKLMSGEFDVSDIDL